MHGLAGITGVFLLQGEATALVETGPKSSVDHVLSGLSDAGVDHLDWIIVTHIHLDHAGPAGTLAQPQRRVCRGARDRRPSSRRSLQAMVQRRADLWERNGKAAGRYRSS